MPQHLVFDVETQRLSDELPGGWNDLHEMGVACCVAYSPDEDRFWVFGDTDEDESRLRELLLGAERLTGFNIWGFDIPVVFRCSRQEWLGAKKPPHVVELQRVLRPKVDDLLRRIRIGLGEDPDAPGPKQKGWKLDDVARATLGGPGKTGNGVQAVEFYKQGRWADLVGYCLNDTSLTSDLSYFAERYGYLRNEERVVYLPPWPET